jgi:hypothetical protein
MLGLVMHILAYAVSIRTPYRCLSSGDGGAVGGGRGLLLEAVLFARIHTDTKLANTYALA